MEALLGQEYPDIELIIVDDASTDDTCQKALECREQYSNAEHENKRQVRIIAQFQNRGSGHSRNLGAESASSDIFMFVDSDVVVPFDGVYRMTRTILERSDMLAVGAIYSGNSRELNFISDFKNMDLAYRCTLYIERLQYLGSFFMGLKRNIFQEAGGFSNTYIGSNVEDIEFGYAVTKNSARMLLDKKILVDHLKRYTVLSMLKTDFNRIVGMMQIIKMSKGVYKAGAHAPKRYFINLLLPGLILISLPLDLKLASAWLTVALITIFIINNFRFLKYLSKSRDFFFAVRSCFVLFLEYVVASCAVLVAFFIPVKKGPIHG